MTDGLRRFLAARFDRKSQLGIGLTFSVVMFALAIWALSGLLDAVLDNATLVHWDGVIESWFHTHATPAGLTIFDVVTQLGSPAVMVVATLVAIYLWRARALLLLWTWIGANVGGLAVEYALKTTVHRSRPQYAAAYLHGHSYSFPSGHTMASTICYLMLAYMIWLHPRTTPRARRVSWILGCTLVLGVGFSRLYLGVHYPSDVLGGFTAGLAWLAVCGATRRFVLARHPWEYGGWIRADAADERRSA